MQNPRNLDYAALDRALSGTRTPAALTREGRVALIVEVADALLAGRAPNREAALFIGGALDRWLHLGGDLPRDFLQVVKAHSIHTPSWIFHQHFADTGNPPGESLDEAGTE